MLTNALTTEENSGLANTIELVQLDELTPEEQRERLHLERRVERAFYESGKALMELRDRRLYRSTHSTFEDYCRERFGYSRRQPYLLMDAATIFDNLLEKCDPLDHILPTSERQVRPLTKLEPQQQQEVWDISVREAGGKVPSARIVTDVVQRIMERTKAPNPYRVGEVCQIIVKENPELRGKSGFWCIVNHLGDYSCTVESWDGEYTVRIDHLKSLNYTDSECQEMFSLSERIHKLRNSANLEKSAEAVLKCLGELNRPYLTEFEEKLLSFIEQQCHT